MLESEGELDLDGANDSEGAEEIDGWIEFVAEGSVDKVGYTEYDGSLDTEGELDFEGADDSDGTADGCDDGSDVGDFEGLLLG